MTSSQPYTVDLVKVKAFIVTRRQRYAYTGTYTQCVREYQCAQRCCLLKGWWSLPSLLVVNWLALYGNLRARRDLDARAGVLSARTQRTPARGVSRPANEEQTASPRTVKPANQSAGSTAGDLPPGGGLIAHPRSLAEWERTYGAARQLVYSVIEELPLDAGGSAVATAQEYLAESCTQCGGTSYVIDRGGGPVCALCDEEPLPSTGLPSWYNSSNIDEIRQVLQNLLQGLPPGVPGSAVARARAHLQQGGRVPGSTASAEQRQSAAGIAPQGEQHQS